jgi:hypothetical protein
MYIFAAGVGRFSVQLDAVSDLVCGTNLFEADLKDLAYLNT